MSKRQTVKFGRVRLARFVAQKVASTESRRYLVWRAGVGRVGAK